MELERANPNNKQAIPDKSIPIVRKIRMLTCSAIKPLEEN